MAVIENIGAVDRIEFVGIGGHSKAAIEEFNRVYALDQALARGFTPTPDDLSVVQVPTGLPHNRSLESGAGVRV